MAHVHKGTDSTVLGCSRDPLTCERHAAGQYREIRNSLCEKEEQCVCMHTVWPQGVQGRCRSCGWGGRLPSSLRDSGSHGQELHVRAGSRCFDPCFHVALLSSAITKNLLAEAGPVVTKGGHSRPSDSVGARVRGAHGQGGQVW